MGFMNMLTENFWTMLALLLFVITIVSIVLGILLEVYKVRIHASQKMQELRNEELRLQLRLEQQKRDGHAGFSATDVPLPKEPSWAEQQQSGYEMGYQQQG